MRTLLLYSPLQLVREGWMAVMDEQPTLLISGTAGNAHEAIMMLKDIPPDLILADIEFVTRHGLDLLAGFATASRISSVICVSSQFPNGILPRLRRMGVRGCVPKAYSLYNLLKVLSIVSNGGTHYPPADAGEPDGDKASTDTEYTPLSHRELEVAIKLGEGKTTPQIAAALGLSPNTVSLHRHHILRKLKLKNSAQLVNLMSGGCGDARRKEEPFLPLFRFLPNDTAPLLELGN